MLYGLKHLIVLTVSDYVLPLVFISGVYIALFITAKRQVIIFQ